MSTFANIIKRYSSTAIVRPIVKPITARAMHITSLPMWVGKGNNYAYLIKDEKTGEGAIIDPANPPEVMSHLKQQVKEGLELKMIINTHHHKDHAGGNKVIAGAFNLDVWGGKDCDIVKYTPKDGEAFNLGNIKVTALYTPCHTQDSICFFAEDGDDRAVFTGDTLFIGGCGRFFEGTPKEMHKALNETLASLPDDTKVFPGHEYTKGNVKFAKTVLENDAIKRLDEYSQANVETQGKFTIGDEKQHNVFMRVTDPKLQEVTGKKDPIDVMGALRKMKDES